MKRLERNIVFYSILVLSYTIFAILIGMAYMKVDRQVCVSTHKYFPTIVLDAGHGGEDSGAISAEGILEKDINLSIAMYLKQMFQMAGIPVVMIREGDTSIYDAQAKSIREKKISDLQNRLKISQSKEDNVFISIHQNNFTQSQYSGAQIFYSKNHPLSQELAECMKNSVVGLIQANNTRETKPAGKNIYLLWESKVPSIIIECGFLSNPKEAQKLNTPEYQKQMAFAIYCGYMEYWRRLQG